MSFRNAIYKHLAGKMAITNLASTRIFHPRAPSKNANGTALTRPYITFRRINNEHTHHMGGDSGFANPVFQFDCWDSTEGGAVALFEAIREEMDTFTGTMGTGGNATTVRRTRLQPGELDTFLPGEGREGGLYGVASTWEFWITETAATP